MSSGLMSKIVFMTASGSSCAASQARVEGWSRASRHRARCRIISMSELKRLDKRHHLPALVGVRQGASHGANIVGHMRRIGGAGDDRRDPRVAEQVFEEKLRPTLGESP